MFAVALIIWPREHVDGELEDVELCYNNKEIQLLKY